MDQTLYNYNITDQMIMKQKIKTNYEYFVLVLKIFIIIMTVVSMVLKGMKLGINNTCGSRTNHKKIVNLNLAVFYAINSSILLVFEYFAGTYFKISKNVRFFIRFLMIIFTLSIHILQIIIKNYCGYNSKTELERLHNWIKLLDAMSFWMILGLILLSCALILYMKYPMRMKLVHEAEQILHWKKINQLQLRVSTTTQEAIDSLTFWMILFLTIEIILLMIGKYTNNNNYAIFLL